MKKDRFFLIYKICLFIFYINSMHPWFLLDIPNVYISLFFLIPTLIAFNNKYFIYSKVSKTSIILCSIMFLWLAKDGNLFGILDALLKSFLFSTIICLNSSKLIKSLKFITKSLGIILLFSSLAYLLFQFGVPLPHTPISLSESTRIDSMENYYLFVIVKEAGFTRFFSIFLEPGYLTLGVAPILFLYKYNLRNKYILILLIGQLLSFSLAGFILLLYGFLYVIMCERSKGKIKKIMGAIMLLSVLSTIAYNYLGEDYLNHTIFRRIQFVDGKLSGDDRSSMYLDNQYERLMESDNYLIGMNFDVKQSEKGVSGYKLFAVENGIIGVILVLLAYFSIISFKNIKLNLTTGAVIFCLLLLYQNSYPWASCVLFPTICAKYVFKKKYAEYLAK